MDLASDLLQCAQAYCEARKIARPTLSGLVFKDSRALDRVGAGGSITIRNYERCMAWLAVHWPDDLPWPNGVFRPLPETIADEAHEGHAA